MRIIFNKVLEQICVLKNLNDQFIMTPTELCLISDTILTDAQLVLIMFKNRIKLTSRYRIDVWNTPRTVCMMILDTDTRKCNYYWWTIEA